jgi:hypothetical protein
MKPGKFTKILVKNFESPVKPGKFRLKSITMTVTLNKEDIEILENLGFKKEFPDDVDTEYFYYVLYLRKHPLLKNPHIMIDEVITLYATERRGGMSDGSDFLVLQKSYSRKNLLKLLGLLIK